MQYKIDDRIFFIKELTSDYKRKVGLSRTKNLPKRSGVILKYTKPSSYAIEMKNMSYPLDIIFILEDKVIGIGHGSAHGPDVVSASPFDKVLEVNKGDSAGIKLGSKGEYVGEIVDGKVDYVKEDKVPVGSTAIILDDKAAIQGHIKGDERIFSRVNTVQMYKLAKIANKSGLDSDYKKLGTLIMKYINKQDTQPIQHVKN